MHSVFNQTLNSNLEKGSTDRFGFALYFATATATAGAADGSWTVTAP